MKTIKVISLFFGLALLIQSCSDSPVEIELTGIIQKQGITTYMYGSHTISGEGEFYALRSSTIDLDDYVTQEAFITGEKISGYPVDGGPDYFEVTSIE